MLDACCGNGAAALPAAVGPDGWVDASDVTSLYTKTINGKPYYYLR